jgi:hypothetical protein
MDRNEILEKNLFEAGRLLKESKRMITLTYSERTYLQQWFYQKTGNRILNRACDIEQALLVFYDVVLDEKNKTKKQAEVEKSETKTTEKQSTTKKTTTTKTKKVESNEVKESEEADDKLQD